MLFNTRSKFGLITKLQHWLSAVSIIGLFILGFWMVDLTYYSSWYKTAPHIHKSIGLLLLIVTIIRLLMNLLQAKVLPVRQQSTLQNQSVKLVHNGLYLALIIALISGYLISTADGRAIAVFNWFELPSIGELFNDQEVIAGEVHKYSVYSLIVLSLVHALAALKHQFIDKDNTVSRML